MQSVLIANRGEIACRIARTARRMGLRVIAVYSEADRNALHVRMADEAVHIGPPAVSESYLVHQRIIDAARQTGAQLIHPGYGFLSENARFARSCAEAGLIFVGPPPEAIEAMGLKDAAKALMTSAGVPVVPGYAGQEQATNFLAEQAAEIGFPVLIKAVAGGGGKGMRRVETAEDFASALVACQRESKAAFGDDRVLIERFVRSPRHIEVQVFCDAHGNAVHLFERDCSMQRRHQKVIEEAPAPGMTDEVRAAVCRTAVTAARAVGYVGAGTVEFIADASNGLRADAIFFMEMNTRLQVEHPVTEAIAGVDLVEWQLRIAQGEALGANQDDLTINGHAIEARVYAEDPANGFLPQTGTLHRLAWPGEVSGLRVDTGVTEGDTITPFYDPMIAKVIAHGPTRDEAIAGLRRALQGSVLLGLKTNTAFNLALLDSAAFRSARHDTGSIDADISALANDRLDPRDAAMATLIWIVTQKSDVTDHGPWGQLGGWTLAGTSRTSRLGLEINQQPVSVGVVWQGQARNLTVSTADEEAAFDVEIVSRGDGELVASIAHERLTGAFFVDDPGERVFASIAGRHLTIRAADLLNQHFDAGPEGAHLAAPMSGRIIDVSVSVGDEVKQGQTLAILEAMKMEHPLKAGFDGIVEAVHAVAGDQVDEGATVIDLRPPDAASEA